MKDVPNMYWYNAVDQSNTPTGQYMPSAKTPWPEVTFQRPGGVNLNFGAVCQGSASGPVQTAGNLLCAGVGVYELHRTQFLEQHSSRQTFAARCHDTAASAPALPPNMKNTWLDSTFGPAQQ